MIVIRFHLLWLQSKVNGKKHARAIMPFILVVVMWNSLLFTLHAFYVSLFDTHMFPTLHIRSRNNPIIVSAIAIFVLAEMESSLLSRHLKVSHIIYIYISISLFYMHNILTCYHPWNLLYVHGSNQTNNHRGWLRFHNENIQQWWIRAWNVW